MPSEKRQRKRVAHQARREAILAAQRRRARNRRLVAIGAVVAVLLLGFAAAAIRGGDGEQEVATATTTTIATAPAGECPAADGSSPKYQRFRQAPPTCIDPSRTYVAEVETTKGTFQITLDAKAAPETVNNFVVLARYHYFDGTWFHRIIPDFVVQGGSPDGTGSGGPGYQFEDELPEPSAYQEGSVAMANSGPDTNGSQFFVVTSANGAKTLVDAVGGEAKYSLFGRVTEGMEVVKEIEKVGTAGGEPSEQVTIESVKIRES